MSGTANTLTAPRAAAIAGVLFSLLSITSSVVFRLSVPGQRGDLALWLNDPLRRNAVQFAIQLVPFAGISFLWFIGVLRSRLGRLEDQFFATVFLGSGLLYVASIFASAALLGSLLDALVSEGAGVVNNDTFRLTRRIAAACINVFAIKMAGVFIMSSSTSILRTAILPRWVAFAGYASAVVLLLIITSWPWIALLFPLWILLVSACILVELRFKRSVDEGARLTAEGE
jgi:hypothetical protein